MTEPSVANIDVEVTQLSGASLDVEVAQLSVANPETDAAKFCDDKSALDYLENRYKIAHGNAPPPPGTMAGNVVEVYEKIIVPCLHDSTPYALESSSEPNGDIRTLWVADVVGVEAPVTTIYDAIALVITLSEPSVHDHPKGRRHYQQLVGLYTCICKLIYSKLVSTRHQGPAHHLPSTAIVVYGGVGPNATRLDGFYGNHACSLSTSLPRVKSKKKHPSVLKLRALSVRLKFVDQVIPKHSEYIKSISENTVHDMEKVHEWQRGNCAETLPITRRSTEGCDMLMGACTSTDQWKLAVDGRPKGPVACTHCGLMMNCLSCPYADMVTYTEYPRAILPRGWKPEETIQPPAWNEKVTLEALAALRRVILTEETAQSSAVEVVPQLGGPGAGDRGSGVGYVESNDPIDTAQEIAYLGTHVLPPSLPDIPSLAELPSPQVVVFQPEPTERCDAHILPRDNSERREKEHD